jgi:hypothetical protein
MRDKAHPTLIDYYKDVNDDLIYRTLPLICDLKTLRLGNLFRDISIPFVVEGFKNTLEEFSFCNLPLTDLATVASSCDHIRRLEIGIFVKFPSETLCYVSRFKYLEELHMTLLHFLSESDLRVLSFWLDGTTSFYKESTERSRNLPTRTVDSSQEGGSSSVADDSRAYPARNSGIVKSFGCLNATDKHIKLISQFYNLTSLVLSDLPRSCSLAPLRYLRLLKNFTLIRSYFVKAEEVLKLIGNQLKCLNLTDVWNTEMFLISQNCRSLECFHLTFPVHQLMSLPWNYRDIQPHSPLLPDFPHVVALELRLTERSAREYVLKCFPNLKKLSLPFTGDEVLLLDNIIQRRILNRLEELYWGSDTVVHFNGNTATKTVFYFDGEVSVQHIRT